MHPALGAPVAEGDADVEADIAGAGEEANASVPPSTSPPAATTPAVATAARRIVSFICGYSKFPVETSMAASMLTAAGIRV
jgi:hypothetical protein